MERKLTRKTVVHNRTESSQCERVQVSMDMQEEAVFVSPLLLVLPQVPISSSWPPAHPVTEGGLELLILQPSKHWGHRRVPLHPASIADFALANMKPQCPEWTRTQANGIFIHGQWDTVRNLRRQFLTWADYFYTLVFMKPSRFNRDIFIQT